MLPAIWQLKKLWEIYEITSSKRVFQSERKTEGVPFYRAREIVKLVEQWFVDNELFISEEMYQEYSKKYGIPQENDIMVTGVWTIGACYFVQKNDRFYFKDWNILWFKAKSTQIDSHFVQYLFKSQFVKSQIHNAAGSVVATLTIQKAKEIQIPLPPLEEQKKIVAYLDELNATISKLKSEYQSQLAMLDEMRNSSLDLAFLGSRERERAYNLNNWKWGKLGDVCEKIQYWFTGKIIEGGRYKYLRITDIQNSEVDWTSVPFVSINEIEAKKYLLKSWEIVFARTGATVGKSFLIWEIWEDKVFASYLIRIIPQYVRIKSEFLKYFFQSKIYWKQIFADATGAAQPNFNAKKLSFLKIPLPDLETQSQIVSHLDQVHQQITMLKTQLNSQIEHCDELWQSSLEKVLTQGVE